MRELEAAVDGDPTEAVFEQIVKVCDGFEAQRRRGERPRIEVFLRGIHRFPGRPCSANYWPSSSSWLGPRAVRQRPTSTGRGSRSGW